MGIETTSWRPDPYGAHELRFFSADGKPTLLVMDGGKTSYHRPPRTERPPARQLSAGVELEPPPTPEPPPNPEPRSSAHCEPPTARTPSLFHAPPTGAVEVQQVEAPSTMARPTDVENRDSAAARTWPRLAVPVVADSTIDRSAGAVEQCGPEALGRPLRIAYTVVFVALAVSALGLAYVHLRPSGGGPSAHAGGVRTKSSSSATTSASETTTTVVVPTVLSPSAEAAANALVSNWSTGNKSGALTVAAPAAVATLFATPYTSGLAIDRGCSTAFSPIVCTFGPPGGASPTDPIYQVLVSQTAGGWYVSSIRVQ